MSTQRISSAADRRIRRVSTGATVVVALSAAVLSWRGLTMLGHSAGLGSLAVLLPLVIDGFMLVGALHVLHSELTGVSTAWGWTMTLAGVILSTWGNVASASVTTPASAIVHAIPALALAATVEATMRIIRRGIGETTAVPQPVAPAYAHEAEMDTWAPVTDGEAVSAPRATEAPAAPSVVLRAHIERDQVPGPERKMLVAAVLTKDDEADSSQATTQDVPANVRAMGEWMNAQRLAGRSSSAGAAVKAEVATSESTARRLQAKAKEAGLVEEAADVRMSA